MAILPLIIAPDARLKTKSQPIPAITDEVRTLAMDMLQTMYAERGVGLAAVQVGHHLRLLVADVEWKDEGEIGTQWVLINPEILENSDDINVHKEGCLSFPDQFADVERPKSVRVRFMDLQGAIREENFTGLLATCVQHEMDHLEGVVFVDHLSRLKREMIIKRLEKMKKQGYFEPEHVHGEHCNH